MRHHHILFGVQLLFEATKQNVAIWTIGIIIWCCNICYSNKQKVWQKNLIPTKQRAWQQNLQIVATQQQAWQQSVQVQQPLLIVAIQRQPLATKYLSWQQMIAPIATTMFSVVIERLPLATKYLSWQQTVPPIATTEIAWQQRVIYCNAIDAWQ